MNNEPIKTLGEYIDHAWEDGAREERQNVVAWLRREASAMHPAEPDRPMLSHSERSLLLVFAACIERGGHDHEVAKERAAVVAFLRGSDDDLVSDYGDDIERGEHRRKESE